MTKEIFKRTAAVAVAFFLACALATYLALTGRVSWEFVLGVLTVGTTTTLALIQFEGARDRELAAKEREIDARLFAQKSESYSNLIKLFSDLLTGPALGKKQMDDVRLARALVDARTALIIWGGWRTFEALNDVSTKSPASGDLLAPIDLLDKLIAAMRVDLGHRDPPGFSREIAFSFIKVEEQGEIRRLDAERRQRERGHRAHD